MGYLLVELFAAVPLFADLSSDDKRYLASRTDYTLSEFEDGDLIIKEDSPSTSFFILIRGAAKITRNSAPDLVLSNLKPGDIFGEMSYLTNQPRSANVVACGEDVMAMRLSQELIQEMTPQIREVLKDKMIELLVQRINVMNDALLALHGSI
ncbi:MAG: cyclic nucleotide-binding domain-containing protein [Proteobacteria bacterium]|nr:cyclic nucleotide-binding domain-containing protein [Pseudomonadota bacterium]